YDPEVERVGELGAVLRKLLTSVVPVCAGINLEYYFSHMDRRGWGCGTKLPHNITALLGVMDGSASDLRPGLPWQMVEIHEAMRLFLVVESDADVLSEILEAEPSLAQLVRNEWIRLACLDPHSSQIQLWTAQGFEPYETSSEELPEVSTSHDWYGGLREHLDYVAIRRAPEEVR
ncbi:MAG: DUF2309 family protein, partial [Planctomycetes bacterium]|nr:DUF2309 family protein [Planctomycetota bacterium]